MFWNRRSSHPTEEDLSAMLDEELSSARHSEVVSHVDGCALCATSLSQLSEVRLLVSRLPEASVPRSFVLTPEMAGVKPAAQRAPKRSVFAFAPALALTVLVALFAVDLSSSSSDSREQFTAGGAGQADIAKSESAADSAGDDRATSPMAASSLAGTPVPATAGAISPSAPSASNVPPDAPPTVVAPMTGAPVAPLVTPVAPSTGNLSAEATDGGEAARDSDAFITNTGSDDDETDWLLLAQIAAAVALLVSGALVFGPALLRKGNLR